MYTGGLLGFVIGGQRHAIYNCDDSDPAGLGQDIMAFILSLEDDEQIASKHHRAKEITIDDNNKDIDALTPDLQERYADFSDPNVGGSDWCRLLSKVQGAAALSAILSGQLQHCLNTGGEMVGEWAYFIDFEKKTLQTWKLAWNEDGMLEEASFAKLAEEGRGYMSRMEEEGKRYMAGYTARMQELRDAKNADNSKDEEDEWDDEEEDQVVGEWDDDLCCDEGHWAIRGAE